MKSNIKNNIVFMCDNLRRLRKQYNMKQVEIAKVLNVSQAIYSKWETANNIIPLTKINTLCNFYKISFDYFFGFSRKKDFENKIDNIDKYIIGSNIKKIRKMKKISQSDLANYLDTTQSVISSIENGKVLISTKYLFKISLKLDTSIDILIKKETN